MDLLTRMSTFVRVVQAGSLSAAARQLSVSTAAVSRHIADLEASVSTALLARTTRRMTLTSAGQRYYSHCQRVLQEVEEAQAVGGEAVGGPIRISVPVTVGQHAGPELIAPLMAEYPRMRVDLRLEDRLIDLALEDVDIAIRAAPNPPMSEQVIAVPLTAWSRILVAAPSYLKRAGTPRMPEDLAGHDVLAPGLDVHAATWSLVREGRTTSVRVRARLVSNGGDALCDLAIAGYGITMLPPWFVAPAIKGRRLARVLPEWESAPTVIYLLYRAAARKQQQVKRVVEHLRRVYAETER